MAGVARATRGVARATRATQSGGGRPRWKAAGGGGRVFFVRISSFCTHIYFASHMPENRKFDMAIRHWSVNLECHGTLNVDILFFGCFSVCFGGVFCVCVCFCGCFCVCICGCFGVCFCVHFCVCVCKERNNTTKKRRRKDARNNTTIGNNIWYV